MKEKERSREIYLQTRAINGYIHIFHFILISNSKDLMCLLIE